jgi:hypothetical protein
MKTIEKARLLNEAARELQGAAFALMHGRMATYILKTDRAARTIEAVRREEAYPRIEGGGGQP